MASAFACSAATAAGPARGVFFFFLVLLRNNTRKSTRMPRCMLLLLFLPVLRRKYTYLYSPSMMHRIDNLTINTGGVEVAPHYPQSAISTRLTGHGSFNGHISGMKIPGNYLRPTIIVPENRILKQFCQAFSPAGDVKKCPPTPSMSHWSIFERNLVGLADSAGSKFQRMDNWPSFDFLIETW